MTGTVGTGLDIETTACDFVYGSRDHMLFFLLIFLDYDRGITYNQT